MQQDKLLLQSCLCCCFLCDIIEGSVAIAPSMKTNLPRKVQYDAVTLQNLL